MTTRAARTGIMGGTFDPVHEGHVSAARAALSALALDRVLLLPSHLPPHRTTQPRASAFHRFAMVSMAAAADARLLASDAELQRSGPSFTSDTLRQFHALGCPASQLFFIIGTDAFAEVASWHEYPAVLALAHFVVISRPGQPFDSLFGRLPALKARMRETSLQGPPPSDDAESGTIWLVRAPTPDVSSTAIRERAARGESLAGLVCPDVERHIVTHALYRA